MGLQHLRSGYSDGGHKRCQPGELQLRPGRDGGPRNESDHYREYRRRHGNHRRPSGCHRRGRWQRRPTGDRLRGGAGCPTDGGRNHRCHRNEHRWRIDHQRCYRDRRQRDRRPGCGKCDGNTYLQRERRPDQPGREFERYNLLRSLRRSGGVEPRLGPVCRQRRGEHHAGRNALRAIGTKPERISGRKQWRDADRLLLGLRLHAGCDRLRRAGGEYGAECLGHAVADPEQCAFQRQSE